MNNCKTDYRNCPLNLIASVSHYFGYHLPHPTHMIVDEMLAEKQYKNIVLLLLDGMSMEILRTHLPDDAFLRRQVKTVMTTVFPSTTPNVTSCLETGLSPREHGWLGWTLYFSQIEKPVDIFINRSRGEPAADYHVANRFIPRLMIFPKITAAGMAKANCISMFSPDIRVKTLDEGIETVLRLARDGQRHYLYLYWSEPDHTMHTHGFDHDAITPILRELNASVEALAEALPQDTLLLVTADHGMVNVEPLYLEDAPEVARMLYRPLTVEARAAAFHVRPEYLSTFPDAFRKAFGDDFLLVTRDEFIRDYLGDGPVRPQVNDFVGDYMALAVGPHCIRESREDVKLIGMHGGLTEQEMVVPLIAYRK